MFYAYSEAAISSKLKSETVLMFEALYCSKYMEFRNILYHNRKMKDDISCMYKLPVSSHYKGIYPHGSPILWYIPSFPFGFKGVMWDLIVLIPDHFLPFILLFCLK